MRRIFSMIVLASLVLVGLVAFQPPQQALATTPPPTQFEDVTIRSITAHDGGGYSATACSGNTQEQGYIIDELGQVRSTIPQRTGSNLNCDNDFVTQPSADGSFFLLEKSGETQSDLVMWRHDRKVWSTSILSPDDCVATSYYRYDMVPKSLSRGPNGEVVLIAVAAVLTPICDDRLLILNPDTGSIEADVSLGQGPALGVGSIEPRAWTYDDKIVAIDRLGTWREFDYEGVEDTDADYSFPLTSGYSMSNAYMNVQGDMFVVSNPTWVSGTPKLMYRKANGTANTITNSAVAGIYDPVLTNNGNLVQYSGLSLTTFNTMSNTASPVTLTNTTGQTYAQIRGYTEDEDGNGLILVWYYDNTYLLRGLAVWFRDGSTGVVDSTPVWELEKNPSDPSSPNAFSVMSTLNNTVADGTLYLSACYEEDPANCVNSVVDSYVYEIDVASAGFGEAVPRSYFYSGYENTELQYVAMGDSFSSGEGNAPYISNTGVSGVNECHRSEDAYAMQIDNTPTLNIQLVAFLACSGATTNDVLGISETDNPNGRWSEAGQIAYLSVLDEVDIVTLSIGGNDIGFTDFATSCVLASCDEYSSIYATTVDNINGLDTVLEASYIDVLDQLPVGGDLYVVNYPMLVPMDKTTLDPIDMDCHYLYNGTTVGTELVNHWGNGQAAQDVIARLNAKIEEVVYEISLTDSRIHYLDVSDDFTGHDVCSSGSYFFNNYATDPTAMFHPNDEGVDLLSTLIAIEITAE